MGEGDGPRPIRVTPLGPPRLRWQGQARIQLIEQLVQLGERGRQRHLPTRLADVPGGLPGAERLLGYIAQDKKVRRGALTFILTRGIGEAFIEKNVDPAAVRAYLDELRDA